MAGGCDLSTGLGYHPVPDRYRHRPDWTGPARPLIHWLAASRRVAPGRYHEFALRVFTSPSPPHALNCNTSNDSFFFSYTMRLGRRASKRVRPCRLRWLSPAPGFPAGAAEAIDGGRMRSPGRTVRTKNQGPGIFLAKVSN